MPISFSTAPKTKSSTTVPNFIDPMMHALLESQPPAVEGVPDEVKPHPQNDVLETGATQTEVLPEHVVSVVPAVETPLTEVEAYVEEYIDLHKALLAVDTKKISARMDEIKTILRKLTELDPPDTAVTFFSPRGFVQFSAVPTMREVADLDGLLTAVSDKAGMKGVEAVTKIVIGNLNKVLSEAESAPFLAETPGTRSLKKVEFKD